MRVVIGRSLAAVLAGLALATGAAAQGGAVDRGKNLYAANCALCHGSNGQGVPSPTKGADGRVGLGPPLQGAGALAADFYLRTGYMPLRNPYAQPRRGSAAFDDREIADLVAYVGSLGGPPVPRPRPERGDLNQGLRLFTENCAGCHQVAAEGGIVSGGVAPPLEDATPVQIAEAVRIGPYLMPRFSRRQLSDADLDSIIAYVEQTKHPEDAGGWAIGHIGPVPEGLVAWVVAGGVLVALALAIGKRAR
jgi:ubiquinol-cytochrome c reductase cytochrome c subunit